MHRNFILSIIVLLLPITLLADETRVLFDGTSTDHWEFAEDAWFIDSDRSLTCRMQEVKGRNGTTRKRGMGYIWTRQTYADFELQLQYKLSEAANSGVFYRSDPSDPVQKGFEVQLLDNEGFQAVKGPSQQAAGGMPVWHVSRICRSRARLERYQRRNARGLL